MVTPSSNHTFVYGLMSTFVCYAVVLEIFKLILTTSGLPLHFVIEPQSAFLSHRSGVTLDCGTEPGSADIQWYFNGSLMTPSKQEVKGISRSRLNLTLNKELGFFHCVASNSDGSVRSLPAFVNSAYLSDFGVGLSDRTIEVTENNTAVIPCATPAGQPSTMTEFEINSTRLLPTARHLVLPSGNLQISKVRMEDSGMYRCTAVNPLTGERRHAPTTVMLKVTESTGLIQPQFTWTPRSHLEVVQGQNLTLECAAEGWPVPQLSWKRYGGVLPRDRSSTIWGNLMIKDVQKSDEGTYICRAEVNATHSQDHVAFVDVLEPPTVTLSSSDRNVTQFDTVTLVCLVTGSPEISVHWYHNALPVVTSPEIIVSSNGSLTLHNVQPRDSGMYQCFAENSVGVAYASARLSVSPRESGGVDIDSFLHDEMQDVATNNDRVTPGTHPSGTRKLKKLQKNSSIQTFSTSPPDVVTESEFSSKVKVEDEVNSPATLLPPSKPTVAIASNTSILLNWTVIQNGSLPVMFFKVQYKEIVDNKKSRWKTLDEEIPPLSRSYEVLALKSGAVYQFRIAAVYSNHDNKIGPTSDRVVLESGLSSSSGRSRVPVSSPMIVDVHEDVTSFVVFWQYKPSERVTVDGFKIFYKPYDDDVDYQSIVVPGPDVRKATVADLKPYTIYSIHMSCFNGDGESTSSLSVARKTLGLSGSSAVPSSEKELLDPIDSEQATTTVAFAFYATNRNNTHASNELLFIVLGVVLGIMVLGLCVVMVMCACKQRQQRRLFAALDGHRRFHDPSRAIYIGSQMTSPAEGNFLLNGVGPARKKPPANGYLSVSGNGVGPGDNQPTSEHENGSNSSKAERNREEIPLKVNRDLPRYEECSVMKSSHVLPLTDDRQTGRDPTLVPEPSGHAATSYHPPKDLPTMSRPPRDVPFHSLKSSRVPCDPRLHGNDGGELCPPFPVAAASPDHIPRLHECQLLYRSPEHTRRSRDRAQQGPRHERVSDRSLSASSQLSGDRLRQKPPVAEIEPHVVGSKIANILTVELNSSDDADGHPEDGADVVDGLDLVLDLGCSTEDSTIPVGGQISRDSHLSPSQSDCRNNSDCLEAIELSVAECNVTHSDSSNPRRETNS